MKTRGNQPSLTAAKDKMPIPEAIEWPNQEYDEGTTRRMVKEMGEELGILTKGSKDIGKCWRRGLKKIDQWRSICRLLID